MLLSCKSENIHGNIYSLIQHFSNSEKELVVVYESEIAALLNFEFHVPSPYLKVLGILIILQERGRLVLQNAELYMDKMPQVNNEMEYGHEYGRMEGQVVCVDDVNGLWMQCMVNMDRIIVCDEYFVGSVRECALAAVPFRIEVLYSLFNDVKMENVERIRESAKKVYMPKKEDVDAVLKKIECKS